MDHIKPWKILSSKLILDHPKLRVYEDVVDLPDGNKDVYVKYDIDEPDAVIVIAINNRNEVLIQREYSHPPKVVLWQLPGGSMHKDERPKDAANRELAEESGYSAKRQNILGYFYTNNRLSSRKQHIVLCKDLFKKQLQKDNDEFIESYWKSLDELLVMITNGEVNNVNMLAALMVWLQGKS